MPVNSGSRSRSRSSAPPPQPRSATERAPHVLQRGDAPRRGGARPATRCGTGRLGQRVVQPPPAARSSASASRVSAAATQRAAVRQVAAGDQVALGCAASQPLAGAQQLVDLVLGDPVVLAAVEHGQQHVEVVEGVGQPQRAGQRAARRTRLVAPLGHLDRGSAVADLSSPAARTAARPARRRRAPRGTWTASGIGVAASSGRASQRPESAVRKTSPSAVATIDDAAYGRSLTYWPRLKPVVATAPDQPDRIDAPAAARRCTARSVASG